MTTPGPDQAHRPPRPRRDTRPGGLVASMLDDDPEVGVLLLAGRLGPYDVSAAGEHMTELLDRGVRDVTVDAGALAAAPREILDLFVRTQVTLAGRDGLVRIFGLRPEALLTAPADGRVTADAGSS